MAKSKELILSKAEKMLVRGLIEFHRESGIRLKPAYIEHALMEITGNGNLDHRFEVEAYAEWVIVRR